MRGINKSIRPAKSSIKNLLRLKKTDAGFGRSRRFYIGLTAAVLGLVISSGLLLNVWLAERSAAAPVKHALVDNQPIINSSPLIAGTPVHIVIPSVNINLNVIPGYYYPVSKSWTLSLTNAQYGVMTAKANNKAGDTFIYAHARSNDFGPLPGVRPGDLAIVKTDNGHSFTYKFTRSTITVPTDLSLFTYKGKPILVLQTCTGLWWQDRQLFVFDFEKAS